MTFENILFILPSFILLFSFSLYGLWLLISYLYREEKVWEYQNHIFISKLLKQIKDNKEVHIFTLNSKNYLYNLKYLPKIFKKVKKYEINKELSEYNYNKFNIRKINLANASIITKILDEKPNECLIIQNMNKPRDYFEIVASLLVNNLNATISIMTLNEPKIYFANDFTVRNILKSGSHIFYEKRGVKKNFKIYSVFSMEYAEKIIIGNNSRVKLINFLDEIKNVYFHIKIYLIDNEKFGISIIQNYLELEEFTLYYIAQFYNL